MPQAKKGKLNYRCPSCFAREIDMDMFFDEKTKEYYCLRCCYHGTEEEVKKANELCKLRYKMIDQRVDDIGKDDEPLRSHQYKKGEL
jgi:hypothetical protein